MPARSRSFCTSCSGTELGGRPRSAMSRYVATLSSSVPTAPAARPFPRSSIRPAYPERGGAPSAGSQPAQHEVGVAVGAERGELRGLDDDRQHLKGDKEVERAELR